MEKVPKQSRSHAFSHEVEVPAAAGEVFRFLRTRLPEVYSAMAAGHEFFTVRGGGPLEVGSVIDCRETAANQTVTHVYEVLTLEPDRRIRLRSGRTRAEIRLQKKTVQAFSASDVVYDLEPGPRGCRIRLTVTIQLASGLLVFLNRLIGGFRPWEEHCVEELEGLGRLLGPESP